MIEGLKCDELSYSCAGAEKQTEVHVTEKVKSTREVAEHRGFKIAWSAVHEAWRFTYREAGEQKVIGSPTIDEAKRTIDFVLARASNSEAKE